MKQVPGEGLAGELASEREKCRKKRAPRPSLRKAVSDFCRYCIYDPSPGLGTWREQVEGCPATDCPLYPVRPLSTRKRRIVGTDLE